MTDNQASERILKLMFETLGRFPQGKKRQTLLEAFEILKKDYEQRSNSVQDMQKEM